MTKKDRRLLERLTEAELPVEGNGELWEQRPGAPRGPEPPPIADSGSGEAGERVAGSSRESRLQSKQMGVKLFWCRHSEGADLPICSSGFPAPRPQGGSD